MISPELVRAADFLSGTADYYARLPDCWALAAYWTRVVEQIRAGAFASPEELWRSLGSNECRVTGDSSHGRRARSA